MNTQHARVPDGTEIKLAHSRARNGGTKLKPDWFEDIAVNRSATERRAATLTTRRTVKKEYQAAWLVKAITCIDLTTLAGDDTAGREAQSKKDYKELDARYAAREAETEKQIAEFKQKNKAQEFREFLCLVLI